MYLCVLWDVPCLCVVPRRHSTPCVAWNLLHLYPLHYICVAWCFRTDCENENVPPPNSFVDGQASVDGSYLACVQNEFSHATILPVSDNTKTVEQLCDSDQNCSGTGLNWMQQWFDKSVSQNEHRGHLIGAYDSPVSDAFSDANNFHLSPVALSNDDSGLVGVSPGLPDQSAGTGEHCLPSVYLADLLRSSVCTTITPAAISDMQQPQQLDSVQLSSSQLPGGQITYVRSCTLFVTYLSLWFHSRLSVNNNYRPC